MQEKMTRLETFVNLGYTRDPFKAAPILETSDVARGRRIITMAVNSHAMISIVGERGCGKSEVVKACLRKMKGIQEVWAIREDQENLTIKDIKAALIITLSGETVKRGAIVSSMQLRRIIGEASSKQQVVLIVEEAQRLHPSTLRSLKTLREIEWAGEKELFTILLVSQSDPMNRPGVSEVQLRSDMVRMNGITPAEAAYYITEVLGTHFEPAAIEALAELTQAQNYLELQALCVDLINIALAAGREQVSPKDVQSIQSQTTAPIPQAAHRKQAAAPVSGSDALKSVLGRRTGGEVAEKAAVHA